jgi:hypothetical protein
MVYAHVLPDDLLEPVNLGITQGQGYATLDNKWRSGMFMPVKVTALIFTSGGRSGFPGVVIKGGEKKQRAVCARWSWAFQ